MTDKPQKKMLIAFDNQTYKTINPPFIWKQTNWLHITKPDGNKMQVNLSKVNYMEEIE